MTADDIYTLIRKEKEERGLTYRQIGALAGYDFRGLFRIINGQANPRFETMVDLLNALGFELVIKRKE